LLHSAPPASLKKGKPAVRQTQNIKGFIFSSFYYTNILVEIYKKLASWFISFHSLIVERYALCA